MNRKNFLKNIGLGLGSAISSPVLANINNHQSTQNLTNEMLTFLKDYGIWLKEFNQFVTIQKNEPKNIQNNKKLMELSYQAEKRKSNLEEFMKNNDFKNIFEELTEEITNKI